MLAPWENILLCMALWFVAWTFFFFGLFRRGIGYVNHFLWTTGYFLSVAAITAIVFSNYVRQVVQGFVVEPFIVLVVVIILTVLIYLYAPQYIKKPERYLRDYPDYEYLVINWRRLIPKFADILAQQLFIVLLILFLQQTGLPLYGIILAFFGLFGLLHIPLIARGWGTWSAWVFGAAVISFSILFPVIILNIHYGFVYTYIIHWLFYLITAIGFWVWKLRRREAADMLQ